MRQIRSASSLETIKKIETFLELNIKYPQLEIKKDINDRYFELWKKKKKNIFYKRNIKKSEELEKEINLFGYSFKNI